MLDRYFTLEDPTRLEPGTASISVEAVLASGLRLRGYIDRLDIARTGEIRIVDYKTGTSPSDDYEARALFQMKFYALVLWRTRGTVPRLLQLIYLGNGEIMRYEPDEADLLATERKINALWQAIERSSATGDWRPRQSRLCDWCAHQALCPVFGGTPPPLPDLAPGRPRKPRPGPGAGAGLGSDRGRARQVMPRRRRISATSASRLSSSAAPPLARLACFAGLAAPTWATARPDGPGGTVGAPPAADCCLSSFLLARLFFPDGNGIPPKVRKISATRMNKATPAQVLGENTNELANCTTAEPIRPTSSIAPVR